MTQDSKVGAIHLKSCYRMLDGWLIPGWPLIPAPSYPMVPIYANHPLTSVTVQIPTTFSTDMVRPDPDLRLMIFPTFI
jgi:hypothetical protein